MNSRTLTTRLAALAIAVVAVTHSTDALGQSSCPSESPTFLCNGNFPNLNAPVVMPQAYVYLVFWGWPNCSDSYCPSDTYGQRTSVEGMLGTVISSNYRYGFQYTPYAHQLTQYSGVEYGYTNSNPITDVLGVPYGIWYDPNIPDAGGANAPWTQAQEYAEVNAAATHFGLGSGSVGEALFVLVHGPGTPGLSGACAYHTNQGVFGDGGVSGTPWIYAVLDYDPQSEFCNPTCGCYWGCNIYGGPAIHACGITTALEHEMTESITDPMGDLAYYTKDQDWGLLADGVAEYADWCQAVMNADGGYSGMTLPSPVTLVPDTPGYVILGTDNAANEDGGSCSFARSTQSDFFAVGNSPYNLLHQSNTVTSSISSGTWKSWGNMGTSHTLAGGPAVTSWPGHIDVFNKDSSWNITHSYVDEWTSGCTSEDSPCNDTSIGGAPSGYSFTSEVATGSWGVGHVDLFILGKLNSTGVQYLLYKTWDNGSVSGWNTFSAPSGKTLAAASAPAVSEPIPGEIDLFVLTTDNEIWHGYVDTAVDTVDWSEWIGPQSYGGKTLTWIGRLTVATWAPYRFDVMVLDSKSADGYGYMWDCGGTLSGGSWGDCGGWLPPSGDYFTISAGITPLGDNRLVMAGRDQNDYIWLLLYDWGVSSGGWVSIGNDSIGIATAGLGLTGNANPW